MNEFLNVFKRKDKIKENGIRLLSSRRNHTKKWKSYG